MDVSKKISVIIPCYNVEGYLERCWKSLERQTIGIDLLECIFVNDGSTDEGKTYKKLQEIEARCPECIMLLNLENNVGLGEARNIGLKYASGKYIQFFDADDELDSDALRLLYETAEREQTDIIQYNHLYILGEQKRSSGDSKADKLYVIENREDRIPFLDTTRVTYGCTNKFIRRDLILKAEAKFPERRRYEEPLFIYPLFLYATRVLLLNLDLYFYYFRPNSIVTSELGKKLLDHPSVQLMLMEYCLARQDIYNEYKDVIDFYFLWSFYLETICFAGEENTSISLEYFEFMQNVCKKLCGEWRMNPMIQRIPKAGIGVLESIGTHFENQEQLDRFIIESKDCI